MTEAKLDTIWFTRCPVPTATGLAYKQGWLGEEFAPDGIEIRTLQENRGDLSRHHYDHQLPTLIREGGALLAIAAKAQEAPSRLIGLTWIEEWQVILVRPGSGITRPEDLKGKRLALPAWVEKPDAAAHVRGSSIARGMSLHGYKGALASAGLTFDDVHLVEVGHDRPRAPDQRLGSLWSGLPDLVEGRVDAAYVKGASAVDAAVQLGLEVGINLDALPGRNFRVNNGTPRPITAHEDFLRDHFDLAVRFLDRTLQAADWARDNADKVRDVLQSETRAGADAVTRAYSDDALSALHPDLSDEKLDLLDQQKNFMLVHGLLDRDFDVREWADHSVLEAVAERRRIRNLVVA